MKLAYLASEEAGQLSTADAVEMFGWSLQMPQKKKIHPSHFRRFTVHQDRAGSVKLLGSS